MGFLKTDLETWNGKKEEEFQNWYAEHAKKLDLNPDPDDPRHFYDYRKAFLSGIEPDEKGHWPSEFKLEGHPRMFLNGINTKTGEKEKKDLTKVKK